MEMPNIFRFSGEVKPHLRRGPARRNSSILTTWAFASCQ
jgi:hypothetical protein